MGALNRLIDYAGQLIRKPVSGLAKLLNNVTGGRLRPNMVTFLSLAGHFLVGYFIVKGHPLRAAMALVVFGLMDALDGALARLQDRSSAAGMLFDATADRLKEIILYTSIIIITIFPAV